MTTYMTRNDVGIGDGSFDSIAWLFECHLKEKDTQEFNFAMVHGNEDAPTKIELWRKEPMHDTAPERVWQVCPGCGSMNINAFLHMEDGSPSAYECHGCGNTWNP